MKRLQFRLAHGLFAILMLVLGGIGLYLGDFAPVMQPLWNQIPGTSAIVYLSAAAPLVTGAGLCWKRTAPLASRLLFVFLCLWFITTKMPTLAVAPASQESWSGVGEFAVVVSAAWIVYLFDTDGDGRQGLTLIKGVRGLRLAQALYGLALIPFGIAHVVYLKETVELVPSWLPLPLAWAIATGCAFLLAGIAIVLERHASLAARLSAVQIGGFTLLVWLPIIAAGSREPFQWSETIISVALSISAIMVAASYPRELVIRANARLQSTEPR